MDIISQFLSRIPTKLLASLIVVPVIAAYLALSTYFIMRRRKKKHPPAPDMSEFSVRMPAFYLPGGILAFVFFGACIAWMLLAPNGTEALWIVILFGFFALAGLVTVIGSLMWKISVTKDSRAFTYTTIFGRSYEVLYADILYYDPAGDKLFIKTAKKRFFADKHADNIFDFQRELVRRKVNRKYKKHRHR